MKRILFTILSLILALSLLAGCDTLNKGNGSGDSSDKNNSTDSFTIEASSDICFLGDGEITISVTKDSPKKFANKTLNIEIIGDDIATHSGNGKIAFSESGAITVKGIIGEVESSNSITIYCLYPDETIAANLSAAMSDSVYLGKTLDIGIKPSVAAAYSVSEDEGYSLINSDGQLEFIGIHLAKSRLRLLRGEEKIFEAMYSTDANGISAAIISSLKSAQIIGAHHTDADNGVLALAKNVDLSYSGNIQSPDEYGFLKYLTSLEALDFSGMPLFDLAFLENLQIKKLSLNNCQSITNNDSGLTIYNTLDSLSSLEELSLIGSLSCFDRVSYDMIASMVRRDKFKIQLVPGDAIDGGKIDGFSKTVFFGYSEYSAHIKLNDSEYIIPAEGFSHAILCFSKDSSAPKLAEIINASNLTYLDLYGNGSVKYLTAVKSANDLTLNLYNYNIDLSKEFTANTIQNAISIYAELTLNAPWGSSSVRGCNGYYLGASNVTSNSVVYNAGAAVFAESVILGAGKDASLTLVGGNGADGRDGIADGSDPTKHQSNKHAEWGWNGGFGVESKTTVHIACGKVMIYGGGGGKGGKGGDGSGENMLSHGFDGGVGGNGGEGGYAVCCKNEGSFTYDAPAEYTLSGGGGGGAGAGGNGYLAGIDGADGTPGNPGGKIFYYD